MIHLRAYRLEDGEDVAPVYWTDNYFSLLPGEEKTISLNFATGDLHGNHAALKIEGYNIVPHSF